MTVITTSVANLAPAILACQAADKLACYSSKLYWGGLLPHQSRRFKLERSLYWSSRCLGTAARSDQAPR